MENGFSPGLFRGMYHHGRDRPAPLPPDENHVHDEDQAENEADDPRGEDQLRQSRQSRQFRLVDIRHVVDEQAPCHHVQQGAHSSVWRLLKGRHKR